MEQEVPKFRAKTTLVNPKELTKIFALVAGHNYRLGAQMGYRKGREDQTEGKPFDLEIGRLS